MIWGLFGVNFCILIYQLKFDIPDGVRYGLIKVTWGHFTNSTLHVTGQSINHQWSVNCLHVCIIHSRLVWQVLLSWFVLWTIASFFVWPICTKVLNSSQSINFGLETWLMICTLTSLSLWWFSHTRCTTGDVTHNWPHLWNFKIEYTNGIQSRRA